MVEKQALIALDVYKLIWKPFLYSNFSQNSMQKLELAEYNVYWWEYQLLMKLGWKIRLKVVE